MIAFREARTPTILPRILSGAGKGLLFMAIAGVTLLASLPAGGEGAELSPFYKTIDHNPKIVFISKFSSQEKATLVRAVAAADKDHRIELYGGTDALDRDVYVFFVDDWSDVGTLPMKEEFRGTYVDAEAGQPSEVRKTYIGTMSTSGKSRPILTMFYKLDPAHRPDFTCLAEDIVIQVTEDDLLKRSTHFCP